jgi:hypothetical protein
MTIITRKPTIANIAVTNAAFSTLEAAAPRWCREAIDQQKLNDPETLPFF